MKQTILQFYLNLLSARRVILHEPKVVASDVPALAVLHRLRIIVDHGDLRGGARFTAEWLTADAAGGERWMDPRTIRQLATQNHVRWAVACSLKYLIEGAPDQNTVFGGGVLTQSAVYDDVIEERFEPLWVSRPPQA